MLDVLTMTTPNLDSIAQSTGASHPGNYSFNGPITTPGLIPEWSPVESNALYRTTYTIISLVCMIILALMLGKFPLYKYVTRDVHC